MDSTAVTAVVAEVVAPAKRKLVSYSEEKDWVLQTTRARTHTKSRTEIRLIIPVTK